MKAVVSTTEVPLDPHEPPARADRRSWRIVLECGHVVTRASYGSEELPERCRCDECPRIAFGSRQDAVRGDRAGGPKGGA